MATLSRETGKVFGGEAPIEELGVFGSAKTGTPQNPDPNSNVSIIQQIQGLSNNAYLQGWGSGIVSSENFPPMEEVTGVLRTISYQACYLLQEGIPVYDAGTEYSATSLVKTWVGNTLELYKSKVDGNKGNALTDTSKWVKAEVLGTRDVGVPQITLTSSTLPINCVWLEGQLDYLADADCLYPNLRDKYGTAYNLGNEPAGQYRLPDFRNKYICGLGINNDNTTNLTMGYVNAGLPSMTVSQAPNHQHGVGGYYIYGRASRIGRTSLNSKSFAGCLTDETDKVNSSGFNSTTDSYAHTIYLRAGANISINGEEYTNFGGNSGAAGAHNHTISSSVPTNLSTVKVDGIKVRVYTRYQ